MKDYFKRLQEHPGLGIAFIMTIVGFMAGSSNTSFPTWWQGGLFGMVVMGGVCFGAVLISNFKRKKK